MFFIGFYPGSLQEEKIRRLQVSYDIGALWRVYLCQSKLVHYGVILFGLRGVFKYSVSNTFNEGADWLVYKTLMSVFYVKRVRQQENSRG